MKKSRPKKKWFWAIFTVVFAVLAVKVLVVVTGKPNPAVDYVAEYNRITKPENFDPSENAVPYYRKAIDSFVERPEGLNDYFPKWPGDLDEEQRTLLQEWMDANAEAFGHFKDAAEKPYYWVELKSKDGSLNWIRTPESNSIRHIIKALNRKAQMDASEGRLKEAADNIICCYKAGQQLYRYPFLAPYMNQSTARNAITVLYHTNFDSGALKYLQDSLSVETIAVEGKYRIEFDMLMKKDVLQRCFVHNRRGTGRLAWRCAHWFYMMHGRLKNLKMRFFCFTGPTEKEVLEDIDQITMIYRKLMYLSLPEAKKSGYFDEIKTITENDFFLKGFEKKAEGLLISFNKARAVPDALKAIIGILRYKNDKGDFPETLDELVGTGYLEQVPVDPFTDESMIYKAVDAGFRLYSVGENLSDDGGEFRVWNKGQELTFEDSFKPGQKDIIYWPALRLKMGFPGHFLPPRGEH